MTGLCKWPIIRYSRVKLLNFEMVGTESSTDIQQQDAITASALY